MNKQALVRYTRYYSQFFPFKLNFFIFLAILWAAYRFLHSLKTDTGSFIALTLLMAKIALIFSIIVVSVSFLSVLFSAIWFATQKNVHGSDVLELSMDTRPGKEHVMHLVTRLPHAFKPILGFVKVKLYYNRFLSTAKYILAGRIKKRFIPFGTGLEGNNRLILPHIREYNFSGALVFFEDMLQFFSIPVRAPVQHSLLNLPHSLLVNEQEQLPKKTEEEQIRIEQLRKVEGEFLNYKKFDDSDDVRRIVWKIFAKNKELVVRTPEIMDPFASHIYMYASFYSSFPGKDMNEYAEVMLNFYKNCVWTIYEALGKKEFEVRYVPDQEFSPAPDKTDPVRYRIAMAHWQHERTMADYFKARQGSILCLHSFSSIDDLDQVLSQYESGTTLFFIQLSKVFRSAYLFHWMMRILFRPPNDPMARMKSRWALNPMKYSLQQHEQKILKHLKQQGVTFEVI